MGWLTNAIKFWLFSVRIKASYLYTLFLEIVIVMGEFRAHLMTTIVPSGQRDWFIYEDHLTDIWGAKLNIRIPFAYRMRQPKDGNFRKRTTGDIDCTATDHSIEVVTRSRDSSPSPNTSCNSHNDLVKCDTTRSGAQQSPDPRTLISRIQAASLSDSSRCNPVCWAKIAFISQWRWRKRRRRVPLSFDEPSRTAVVHGNREGRRKTQCVFRLGAVGDCFRCVE